MAELKALPTAVLLHIAKLLNVPLKGLDAVIELLDEGATVPFIARYRKEVTGNLDEVQIRDIQEKLEYFRELEERRETVLASIAGTGQAHAGTEGEDRGRAREDRTRRSVPAVQAEAPHQGVHRAREGPGAAGAVSLGSEPTPTPLARVRGAVRHGRAEEALEGARHIIAEWISENAEFRKAVRAMMMADGRVVSRAIEGVPDPEGKFKMYAQLQRAGVEDSVAPHAGDPPRRQGRRADLRDRARPRSSRWPGCARSVMRTPGDWVPHLEAGRSRIPTTACSTRRSRPKSGWN